MLVIAAAAATPAAAQSPRVEVSANVGVQTGAKGFTESDSFPSNGGETATVTADHATKTAMGFNIGGAVKVISQLWVGVQFAATDMDASAAITAVIPHPLLFNAPRTVQGTADGLHHKEQNVHVDLMYALPVSGLDVKVMAGPTFFNLKQDFVAGVTVNETYPFDTATFGSATTRTLSNTAVGFNAGVDIARALTPQFAIGGLIRYSQADVKFDDATLGHQTVKAGGLEAGAGVRLRF
jgi:hypothetical protein